MDSSFVPGRAHRVGALVLQGGLGQHNDGALLHDGLELVHALVEAAAADLAALSVQQLKGEQLACAYTGLKTSEEHFKMSLCLRRQHLFRIIDDASWLRLHQSHREIHKYAA